MKPRDKTRRSAAGFSLLEVMIALTVLGIGLLTLAAMQVHALTQGAAGRHTNDAAAVGRSTLEQAQRIPWADLTGAVGAWTAPAWAGGAAVVNTNVDMPGGGTAVQHSYNVLYQVTDIGASGCLRDIEVRVSWAEDNMSVPKQMDLATRRYNWGAPTC